MSERAHRGPGVEEALRTAPAGTAVDVVMLLEGTYPFVRGGVSSWVHQLLTNTPDRRFHLVFLGGSRRFRGEARYEMPPNVVALEEHYLLDEEEVEFEARAGDPEAFACFSDFLRYFNDPDEAVPTALFARLLRLLDDEQGIPRRDFLHSEAAWGSLADTYLEFHREVPFTQYFWTYRNLYAVLFRLARIARGLPPARLYHTISTGYAGWLGAGASLLHGVPLLVSEHGIYTKERFIDINQADWIVEEQPLISHGLSRDASEIRRIWIAFFEQLGVTAYQQAARIVSLYGGNRQRQIADGASEARTLVIPNGIDLSRFGGALAARRDEAGVPRIAGLVGRVVPIKDIKTFVRSILQASAALPDLEGWIIGPTEEDEDYHEECVQLVAALGLGDRVRFLGMQNVAEILPRLGLTVLTSISEAQPLVLLEGLAAGVPFVATDVGACRDIAYGLTPEDRALGAAGEVVPIASPQRTADVMVRLLSDGERWRRYQGVGLERVRRIYDEQLMYARYRALYEELA